jgi:hypothetical protein
VEVASNLGTGFVRGLPHPAPGVWGLEVVMWFEVLAALGAIGLIGVVLSSGSAGSATGCAVQDLR